MYHIHGVLLGAQRVVLTVKKVPKLQEIFKPTEVVYSKRELGFNILKRCLIAYDYIGEFTHNGLLIPSFVLKVVEE